MTRAEYETMKVAELKAESRKRNLTLEHKGHKFTKSELIERLLKDDEAGDRAKSIEKKILENDAELRKALEEEDDQRDIQKKIDEAGVIETETKGVKKMDVFHPQNLSDEYKDGKKKRIDFRNVEQLVEHYGGKKKQEVYDKELVVGAKVIFAETIKTKAGEIVKKLRKAKVIAVNRKQKLVRVQMLYGKVLELKFEELLFITSFDSWELPTYIDRYFRYEKAERKQRRAKAGVENER